MATVRMTHPTLPGQVIEVSDRAALHHGNAGWELVEDAAEAPAPEPPAEPQDTEPKAPRSRRAKEQ